MVMMKTYCNAFGMTVKIHDPYEGYDDLFDEYSFTYCSVKE